MVWAKWHTTRCVWPLSHTLLCLHSFWSLHCLISIIASKDLTENSPPCVIKYHCVALTQHNWLLCFANQYVTLALIPAGIDEHQYLCGALSVWVPISVYLLHTWCLYHSADHTFASILCICRPLRKQNQTLKTRKLLFCVLVLENICHKCVYNESFSHHVLEVLC